MAQTRIKDLLLGTVLAAATAVSAWFIARETERIDLKADKTDIEQLTVIIQDHESRLRECRTYIDGHQQYEVWQQRLIDELRRTTPLP